MLIAEIRKLLRKKALVLVTALMFVLPAFWIFITYNQGVSLISAGTPYQESGLSVLEPNRIFSSYMLQMSLSIYIFPLIVSAVLFVIDDIKERALLQISISNRKKWVFVSTKIGLYCVYVFLVFLGLFLFTLCASLFLKSVSKDALLAVVDLTVLASFILNWFGAVTIGAITIAITYLTGSGIAGNCFIVYLMLERLFTSGIAISTQSEILMKLNEFLPWANLNSLFVYAGNISSLYADVPNTSSYVYLSMYRLSSYHGSIIAMPFFKPLPTIILICAVYFLFAVILAIYGCNYRLKKM